MSDRLSKIRNFCIIAHIDHGKSTLADRILEMTGVFEKREMTEQILDSMELERERGITIKSKAVNMQYKAKDGETYTLNLIDTPGHVDFTYEVSRALAACEGALLVVDATQGIEAQTLANVYMALDADLEIIPVINKIDLPSAQPEEVKAEIEDVIGLDASYAPCVSAKTGLNIEDVLEAVVEYVPAPTGDENAPLQALIFDAFYDNYRGAICFVRVKEGTLKAGMRMRLMATGGEFDIVEVGTFNPGYQACDCLKPGDVGYVAASIKDVRETRVGDTITNAASPAADPLPGYRQVTPMVYCGVYPADGADYPALKDALEKLRMNDASLSFEPETSVALGYGFRCGFLGLLHMDIITTRLEREWDLNLVTTAPSVIYRVTKTDGTVVNIDNPSNLPPIGEISMMEEPFVSATIYTPQDSVGAIMDLCQDKRGIFLDMQYEGSRIRLHYELPLNEIIFEFFDQIKSRSRGYASFDYELKDYRESDLVKLDILLNGDLCDAFSIICHRDKAYGRGRNIAEKLKDVIPRQMFEIPIQAAIGGKVIARETVKAMRKD
ncbi:MAG: translation elongation factor 4, partial [Clostridia bacterium]|nr:translation elongation factor 4 [Clostridia bacterium]